MLGTLPNAVIRTDFCNENNSKIFMRIYATPSINNYLIIVRIQGIRAYIFFHNFLFNQITKQNQWNFKFLVTKVVVTAQDLAVVT